jgi:hypothetical protein
MPTRRASSITSSGTPAAFNAARISACDGVCAAVPRRDVRVGPDALRCALFSLLRFDKVDAVF